MKNHPTKVALTSISYLVATLLLLMATRETSAQPGTWIGGDGNWSDTANWFGTDVPNTAIESASVTNGSAVVLDSSFTIEGLTIGSLDSLEFPNSSDLTLNDNITNDGTITLNGTTSATELRTNVDVTFAGTGEVVFGTGGVSSNDNMIGASSSAADSTLTNSAGHTIRALGPGGLGRGHTAIVNEGLIVADGASANLLVKAETATGGLTNTGTVRATNNGQLEIQSLTTNTGALIESNSGGLIILGVGADIIGGEITGDVAVNAGASGSTPGITDLTTSATINLANAADLTMSGTITNNGTITLNGTASTTEVRTNVDVTFAGTGEVVFGTDGVSSSGDNVIGASSSAADSTLTNSAGHTIRALGPGSLGRGNTAIVNGGLIVADGASANLLVKAKTATGGLTNTGTVRATNNGQLEIQSFTTNTGALIESTSGGLIILGVGADIIGGEIIGDVAVNAGASGSTPGITDLTTSSTISIADSADLTMSGTITNNGTITLNGTTSRTEVRTNVDVTFAGTGEVVFGTDGVNSGDNVIGASSSAADSTLTNSAGHTIRALGIGSLGRGLTAIVNEGLIVADGASANLRIDSKTATGGLLNSGTISAIGGGRVEVDSDLDNSGGTIEAIGAGSTVESVSGFVVVAGGGTYRALDGGSLVFADLGLPDTDIDGNGGVLDFRGSSYTDMFDDTSGAVSPLHRSLVESAPGSLQSDIFKSNSGTFRIGEGLNFTTNIAASSISTTFTNGGTIVAGAGSVFSAGGFIAHIISGEGGGGIYVLNGYVPFISTGTLAGSGEIRNTYVITASAEVPVIPRTDDLHSDGFIKPGDNPGETGTLTLFSIHKILLGDTNVIEIEIGDGEHDAVDLITASDPVALNGELDVSFLAGYSPSAGDSFDIITAVNGLTGVFDTETLPGLSGGLDWLIDYAANTVTLEILLPGDYNDDGSVDGSDFLVWQRTDGTPAGLSAWQGNYGIGSGTGSLSATATVPEPTSLVLVGMCALMLVRRHRLP